MIGAEMLRVVAWDGLLGDLPGLDLHRSRRSAEHSVPLDNRDTHRLPVNHTWYLERELLLHLFQCILEILALLRAGSIAPLSKRQVT